MSDHTVTATEPAWVEQKHEPDETGMPHPVSEPETQGIIDDFYQESTYECTCGEDLSSWDEVVAHFDEVSND